MSDESINMYYNIIKIYIRELYLDEKLCLNQFEGIVIPYFISPFYGLIGHWVWYTLNYSRGLFINLIH